MPPAVLRRSVTGLAIGLALVWSAILMQVHLRARASVLDRIESSLLDWRILAFGPRPAPPNVMILSIDDDTIHALGGWPVPRHMLAEAVSRLFRAGVRAVLIDALFLDPAPDPHDDAAFAGALVGKPAAVAAMIDFPLPSAVASVPSCRLPVEPIRRVAAVGLANIALDASGVVRHVPMMLACGDDLLPALPLRVAALAAGDDPVFADDGVEIGGVSTPLDVGSHLALRFYGPEATIATASLSAFLNSGTDVVPVKGRTVMIGATARGVADRYPTPFDSVLPGVEIMATAVANLQNGDALIRTGRIRLIDAAATMLLPLALAASLLTERLWRGLLASGALFLAWVMAVLLGFAHGVWFAMAVPLAAACPSGIVAVAARLTLNQWEERRLGRVQRALSGFHAPAMLTRLTTDPLFLAQPVEREVAVVFIDLSGFTGLSERLGPRTTRDLLKQWHEIVEDAVEAGGGFVVSYMADGAMAVWGLVEKSPRDPLQAVRTAVLLEARTAAWLKSVETQTGPIGVKLGGHCGIVTLSRLGHARHLHITAIGDTVNVAARLMDVAAAAQSSMAISLALLGAAQRQGLADTEAGFAPPHNVPIRGRANPIVACLRIPEAGPQSSPPEGP